MTSDIDADDDGIGRRHLLRGLGATAAAAALLGTADRSMAQTSPTGDSASEVQPAWGDWFSAAAPGAAADNYDGTTDDRRGESGVTVEVGADGNGGTFAYEPPALWIDPGTTVTFEWVSDTHNVLIEDGPDGAGWSGHGPIENTGFSFEHTFETGGVYRYYCEPHLALGMKGAIAVGDDVETEAVATATPTAGETGPIYPGGDVGIAFVLVALGSAGAAAAAVLLGEAYAGLRGREPRPAAAEGDQIVREIDHEEFDPVGTATLIAIYFAILLFLWVFMYFVEFLGNGPTITG